MVGNRSHSMDDKASEKMKKILSSNTLVTQLFLLIAIIGSTIGFIEYGVTIENVSISILGYFLYVCLGIVVTFHRNLTHHSYTTHPWIVKIFSFLGCMSNTGSSIVWVSIHMKHHLNSDKKDDPHSPWNEGWKVFLLRYPIDPKIKWRIRNLIADPYHRFLHQYYYALLIGWSLLLYLIGGAYLMIFLHWMPVVLAAFLSNIVNFAGHKGSWLGSYRRYNLSDKSVNNWIWAIPTWGESWHNNHHRHPRNWSCGERWWEIDISAYVISLIKYKA